MQEEHALSGLEGLERTRLDIIFKLDKILLLPFGSLLIRKSDKTVSVELTERTQSNIK